MTQQERPLIDRIWDFTKDLSVKVSRKAEKHWKINTLKVEIASIKHRINVKHKELGRYVYESLKSQTLEEESYKSTLREFFDELKRLETDILDREGRIEILEQEMKHSAEDEQADPEGDQVPPPPPPNDIVEEEPASTGEAGPEAVDQSSTETSESEDASESETGEPKTDEKTESGKD